MLQPYQHDPYRHEEHPDGSRVGPHHIPPEGQMVIPYLHRSTTPDRVAGIKDPPEAPHGYYRQDGHAQLALPGMEMTPEEHVEALGRRFGAPATIVTYHASDMEPGTKGSVHRLTLGGPTTAAESPYSPPATFQSHMEWGGREGASDTMGLGLEPGEISMVQGEEKGHAAAMHATARRIAAEHPQEYSLPRHSDILTAEGKPWAAKESRKYGEDPWMEGQG